MKAPIFPALRPSSIVLTFGRLSSVPFRSMSGKPTVSVNSTDINNQTLLLGFVGLPAVNAAAIRWHNLAAAGGFGQFSLPIEVWADGDDLTEPGYSWRYQGPVQVSDNAEGFHDVTVTLLMERTQGVPDSTGRWTGAVRRVVPAVWLAANQVATGSSIQALPITGSATGTVTIGSRVGSSSQALPITGSATGTITGRAGSSIKTLPITGSATGTVLGTGSSSKALLITGSATGRIRVTGSSSKVLLITRSTTGRIRVTGSSSQTLLITGSATGTIGT